MAVAESRWMVVRCAACGRCTGHRQAPRTCSRCGQAFPRDAEVVAYAANANDLQRAVALANTPEELRDELTRRMGGSGRLDADAASPAFLLEALRQAADASGVLVRSAVDGVLRSMEADQTVDDVMAMVESEGLVLRLGHGRWRFIE